MEWFYVMTGAALGGALRYFSVTMVSGFIPGFPYGTLLVNVVGSFIMGLLATYFSEYYLGASPYLRLFCTVGFLGGFTTFSSFSYETLSLLAVHNLTGALCNVLLNTTLGLFAGYLGIILIK
jgi:CrcB protein